MAAGDQPHRRAGQPRRVGGAAGAGYYREEWEKSAGEACHEAREFLRAVRRYSNLLVERGKEQYGFLHLTFEEMLAAKGIAAQTQEEKGLEKAVETILRYVTNPHWHETILLAVGVLGIVNQQPILAGRLLKWVCGDELEGKERGQNVIIAGEALLDVGEVGVGRRAAAQVTKRLVETMQDAETPARARHQAGLILGRLDWPLKDLDAFVEIPPGSFKYGDEREQREINYCYWIGKYPVTNAQYARFVDDNGCQRREFWSDEGWAWRKKEERERPNLWDDSEWNNPIFPVAGVTWYEAEAYCKWLTAQRQRLPSAAPADYVARLPTEEEWERAARGDDGREYPWGDTVEAVQANTGESGTEGRYGIRTTAVCTYPQGANPAGVWDAAGNVWEWTVSRWKSGSDFRVVRGGSWLYGRRRARRAGSRAPNMTANWGINRICHCRLEFPPMNYLGQTAPLC